MENPFSNCWLFGHRFEHLWGNKIILLADWNLQVVPVKLSKCMKWIRVVVPRCSGIQISVWKYSARFSNKHDRAFYYTLTNGFKCVLLLIAQFWKYSKMSVHAKTSVFCWQAEKVITNKICHSKIYILQKKIFILCGDAKETSPLFLCPQAAYRLFRVVGLINSQGKNTDCIAGIFLSW